MIDSSQLPLETPLYRRPPQFVDTRPAKSRPADGRRVWYAFLCERAMYDLAFMRACQVSARAATFGYQLIETSYQRTDNARNGLCEAFLSLSRRPDDTLVMLDVDHAHPKMVVPWLVQHDVEVVVPLMFRRGPPYEACAFRKDAQGNLYHLSTENLAPGLHRMDGGVGTGAIAIQRRALEKLSGQAPFWFRYEYIPEVGAPSEDMYFCKQAAAAGVEMWVDTVWETPHLSLWEIDREVSEAYAADHPDDERQRLTIDQIDGTPRGRLPGVATVPRGQLDGGGNGKQEASGRPAAGGFFGRGRRAGARGEPGRAAAG